MDIAGRADTKSSVATRVPNASSKTTPATVGFLCCGPGPFLNLFHMATLSYYLYTYVFADRC